MKAWFQEIQRGGKCHFPGSTREALKQTVLELEVTSVTTPETEARK